MTISEIGLFDRHVDKKYMIFSRWDADAFRPHKDDLMESDSLNVLVGLGGNGMCIFSFWWKVAQSESVREKKVDVTICVHWKEPSPQQNFFKEWFYYSNWSVVYLCDKVHGFQSPLKVLRGIKINPQMRN